MKLHYTVQITNFRNRPWLRAPQGSGFKLASAGFLFLQKFHIITFQYKYERFERKVFSYIKMQKKRQIRKLIYLQNIEILKKRIQTYEITSLSNDV